MLNETLLGALIDYQRIYGKNPDIIRLNPVFYRALLQELNYPGWLIHKKSSQKYQTMLGIKIEITAKVQQFEM
ncbi:hypothetical protein [Bacillus wiedmannii]|uniref:hypothetical protein n=1 Tax=Bacillus wiedmannii TaxID=1890302 RepID=UPI000BEF7A52|nr:hypothetical protein [Bacillus wiedmannii]PEO40991.1 hypothetical protein CN555_02070 [Bacillus wiedmannii]